MKEAKLLMKCHQQAARDFNLQIEATEYELNIYGELPYKQDELIKLQEHKLILLKGRRFHTNAGNAYWYYIQKEKQKLKELD